MSSDMDASRYPIEDWDHIPTEAYTTEQWMLIDEYSLRLYSGDRISGAMKAALEEIVPDPQVRQLALDQLRKTRERLAAAYEYQGIPQPRDGWAPWMKEGH